jgi:CubicO group peptidase (beta-lactamase class C family)
MSLRTASLTLLAGLTLAAPTAAHASPTTPVAAHVEKAAAPAPAPREQAASYADREAKSGQVADYEGGNVVIVLSGGTLVVLLLVLLLVT